MAIIENSLLGQISGRIGELVYYRRCGKTCVRRYVEKSVGPGTELQQQQRRRIRSVSVFYQALKAVGLKEIWNRAAKEVCVSGYNLFVRLNIHVFSARGLITDFSRIRLVVGRLPLPDMLQVRRLSPGILSVKWELKSCYSPKRQADVLVLDFMKSESVYTIRLAECGDVCRAACEARIELPEALAACPHCYCFFKSPQDGEVSESRYFNLNV